VTRGRAGERGSVELVLSLPLAFAMILTVLQIGLWTHAHARAQSVADHALAAARAHGATAEQGHAAARRSLGHLGGRLLDDPRVTVERGEARTDVHVRATTLSLVPGWKPSVSAHQSGPVERREPGP
jgi:hypothetical protein